MSLPWVPFSFSKYFTDTPHLDTEGHGAYLLLLGFYYMKEQPIRDDDRILASLTKMSMERWLALRPILADFFEIKDGFWHHTYCNDVLRDAHVTYNATRQRTAAATAARLAKRNVTSTSGNTSRATSRATPRQAKSSRPRNEQHHDQRDVDATSHVTSTQEQEQRIEGGGGDAHAREAVSLPGAFVRVPAPPPFPLGIPVEHWPDPLDLHSDQAGAMAAFRRQHAERGTFSRDWDAAWRDFLRQASEPAAKPKKRTVAPRIETDKRPEAPPAVRLSIDETAFTLAEEIAALLGVTGMPVTVGWPAQIQVWLAAWPVDVIWLAVRTVMAKRAASGQGPPHSLKYFENAIARTVADLNAPPPDARFIPPASGASPHGQGPKSKSVSDAARRLAEKFAARDAGGDGAGAGTGDAAGGPVPQIGCG